MRPNLLNPLFGALTTLSGVGPKLERLYRRLLGRGEEEARDHRPALSSADRRDRPARPPEIGATSCPGTVVTVAVTVDRHRPSPPHRPRAPYQIYASDETGDLILTFFNARRDYLEKLLPVGELRYVSGTTGTYDGMLQMVHPDRVVDEAGLAKLPLVEPVYPLTEGLGLNQVRKAVDAALPKLPELPEWQEPTWVARERYPTFADALTTLHRPASPADILPESRAWMRLAYDELLAGQLALALVRAHLRRPAGRATPGTGALRKKLIDALPYSLTTSQSQAIADIAADLAKPERMLRLLQGDVGSGKTVVALLSAATVIEGGRQAALMAPTEILARQHLRHHRAARRRSRHRGRDPDRPRARPRTDGNPRAAAARRHPYPGRHPCAVPGRRGISRSRARDRRRAASLRRAPAAGAGQEGRRRRHAGDDRDPDPAHAGADLFRRHGHFRAARKARRPAADRYPHAADRTARRGDRRHRPRARRRAGASTGSVRWSRNPKSPTSPPPRTASPISSRNSARGRTSSTAA